MKLRWKIVLVVVAVLVALAGAATFLGWALSAKLTGERLARAEASQHHRDGAFFNSEPEAGFEITWESFKDEFFGDQQRVPPGPLPVVPLDPARLESKPEAGLRTIWLGHATVLIEIDNYRVLTDPNLSERASPFQFLGPKRFHAPPIVLDRLTGIDAVLVSHNHYDHLDEATVRHLAAQGTAFYVPLGVGTHLEAWDVPKSHIHELDWWEEGALGPLRVVATPARHYSGRGFFDYQKTLWASWSVIGPRHRAFFSGDTGYSALFRDIGEKYGPFDIGIIKVGSYGPGDYWLDIHMSPEDAIQVHLDVRAERLLPVHWATFNLARHDWDEPIVRALAAGEIRNVNIMTPRLGETVDADLPYPTARWWESVGR